MFFPGFGKIPEQVLQSALSAFFSAAICTHAAFGWTFRSDQFYPLWCDPFQMKIRKLWWFRKKLSYFHLDISVIAFVKHEPRILLRCSYTHTIPSPSTHIFASSVIKTKTSVGSCHMIVHLRMSKKRYGRFNLEYDVQIHFFVAIQLKPLALPVL